LDIARKMEVAPPPDKKTMIRFALSRRLGSAPGQRYSYSNLGYLILTEVIERASGRDYESYVKEVIFRPAGCYDIHLAHNFPEQKYPHEVSYYEPSNAELSLACDGSGRSVFKSRGGNDVRGLLVGGFGGGSGPGGQRNGWPQRCYTRHPEVFFGGLHDPKRTRADADRVDQYLRQGQLDAFRFVCRYFGDDQTSKRWLYLGLYHQYQFVDGVQIPQKDRGLDAPGSFYGQGFPAAGYVFPRLCPGVGRRTIGIKKYKGLLQSDKTAPAVSAGAVWI